MTPSATPAAIALLLLVPALHAQTSTIAGGIVADSSTVAPVLDYRNVTSTGDLLAVSLSGWRAAVATEQRVAPSRRRVMSFAVTPYAANNSDHIYDGGERRGDLTFHDTTVEATFGRADVFGERVTSDLRVVALYERVDDVDARTDRFWKYPFAGVRSRVAWSRIAAENPLLLTFRGSEISANVEVFGGRSLWTRTEVNHRASRKLGLFEVSEHFDAMYGSRIDTVSSFLAGGSWPIAGVHTLYGYNYGEFRLRRAVMLTGDVRIPAGAFASAAAHLSAMSGNEVTALGAGADLTRWWRGVGIRIGVGIPLRDREERSSVVYVSLLAARFVSPLQGR